MNLDDATYEITCIVKKYDIMYVDEGLEDELPTVEVSLDLQKFDENSSVISFKKIKGD